MNEEEKNKIRLGAIEESIGKIKEEIYKPKRVNIDPDVNAAKILRKEYTHNNGFTKERNMRHVARIPYADYLMGMQEDPLMFKDKRKLRKFLSKKPYCKVVGNI